MATATRRPQPTPAHIGELVERVLEAAADPVYAQRKEMWTRHNRLEKVPKVPVCAFFLGGYPVVWQELIPPDTLVSQDPLERSIELQLRQKLYKHDHIPDDDVLLPTVWIPAVRPTPTESGRADRGSRKRTSEAIDIDGQDEHAVEGSHRLWGLAFQRRQTDEPGGAYKVKPAMASEADMPKLRRPRYEADDAATSSLWERASELVGGRLPVKVSTNELGASPSEAMVSLLGIEAVLYGVIDHPDFVHKMMDYVTEGYIAYHREREAAGAVDAEASWGSRVHYEELPHGADPRRLAQSWTYISAQSLCGLSPEMYAEFLQPYHARLAAAMGENRVYYHACEDIAAKIPIIRDLPNLRRVHVSPWTDLEIAVEQLGRTVVLEVDVHPADTVFVHSQAQMREALERRMDIAGDCIFEINLIGVETVRGNPTVLSTWARIAQEVTEQYA